MHMTHSLSLRNSEHFHMYKCITARWNRLFQSPIDGCIARAIKISVGTK